MHERSGSHRRTELAALVRGAARTRAPSWQRGAPSAIRSWLAFAFVATVLTAAHFLAIGAVLSPAIALYAPLVVLVAATLGPGAGFVAADGIAVLWALAAGLAATSPGAHAAPARALLDVALIALLLNLVALSAQALGRAAAPRLVGESERARGERDALAARLEAIEPLATTGRLVTNVAHEIGNPLQAIDHLLYGVLEETPEDDVRRASLLHVKRGTERIAQVLEQLSEFYRPAHGAATTDVNRVVDDVCRFLDRQLRNADVKLREQLSPDAPRAAIAEDRLRQAILNVVLNAAEAMPEGGELSISTLRERGRISLAFRDTGTGIPQGALEQAFEPFFTTRADAGGAGLGLAITRRLMRAHGGDARVVDSGPGGTCVVLDLPEG